MTRLANAELCFVAFATSLCAEVLIRVALITVIAIVCHAQLANRNSQEEMARERERLVRALYSSFALASELSEVRPGPRIEGTSLSSVKIKLSNFASVAPSGFSSIPLRELVTPPRSPILDGYPGDWRLNGEKVCSYVLLKEWADLDRRYGGVSSQDWSRNVASAFSGQSVEMVLRYHVSLEFRGSGVEYESAAIFSSGRVSEIPLVLDYVLDGANLAKLATADFRSCFSRIAETLTPSTRQRAMSILGSWGSKAPCSKENITGWCCDAVGVCKVPIE